MIAQLQSRSLVWIGVLAAVLLAACGSGRSSSRGEATKPTAQILADASTALQHVHSFQIEGTSTDKGGSLRLSGGFSLPGKLRATLSQGTGTLRLIVVGQNAYLSANHAFWAAKTNPRVAALLAGHWVKVPGNSTPGFGELLAATNPATIGHCLVGLHRGTTTKVGTATVNGRAAVILKDRGDTPGSSPGLLYVASSGPTLPLRTVQTGPRRPGGGRDASCNETDTSSTTITETINYVGYNRPTAIAAPANALDLSQLMRRLPPPSSARPPASPA